MSKSVSYFCTIISIILTILSVVMLFVVNGNAFTRYVLSFSLPWSEELTRYCMIWIIMLGAGVLALFEDHIALHLPNRTWPASLRLVQKWVQHIVVLVVSALVTVTSLHFAVGMADVMATGLRTSMLWPTLAIPVAFGLITIAKSIIIYNEIAPAVGWPLVPLPPQKSVMDHSFRPAEEEPETGGDGAEHSAGSGT